MRLLLILMLCLLSNRAEASFFMRELIGIEGPKKFAKMYATARGAKSTSSKKPTCIPFFTPDLHPFDKTLSVSLRHWAGALKADPLRQAALLQIYDEQPTPSLDVDHAFRALVSRASECRYIHVKDAPITDMALVFLPEQVRGIAFEGCHEIPADFCVNVPRHVTQLALYDCKKVNDTTLEALAVDMLQLQNLFLEKCSISVDALIKLARLRPHLQFSPEETHQEIQKILRTGDVHNTSTIDNQNDEDDSTFFIKFLILRSVTKSEPKKANKSALKKAHKTARDTEMPILDDELARNSDVLVDDDILEADTHEEEDVADGLEGPDAEEE
ncbi:MAG: hypothetical protein ACK5O7_03345 [Holosporales bacterium]